MDSLRFVLQDDWRAGSFLSPHSALYFKYRQTYNTLVKKKPMEFPFHSHFKSLNLYFRGYCYRNYEDGTGQNHPEALVFLFTYIDLLFS